jgi:threonine dehydrogenase-like Zn-dependent dehydrogenase
MKGVVINAEWAPREGYAPDEREQREHRAVDGSQVWRHPTWSVDERPEPRITEPDQVIVRSRAVGICGSDVHMLEHDDDGYILLAYRTRFPIAFGHEFAGEVIEVGAAVRGLRVGDAVSVEAMNYCGACRPCKLGFLNQCERCEDNGFTLDGGSAEFVLTRERHCWSLEALRERFDEAKIYEIGALMEPTSITYNAMFIRGGGFRPGRHVAIFGCGPIGLIATQFARVAGAAQIVAFDVQAERRAQALACGADLALDPIALASDGSSPAAAVLEATRGTGAGMLIEATGVGPRTMPEIERCLDVGGKVVAIGLTIGSSPVTTGNYIAKAACLCGSMGHLGGGIGDGIALHAAGRVDTTSIVTRRLPFEQGVEAVRRTAERTDGKILITTP